MSEKNLTVQRSDNAIEKFPVQPANHLSPENHLELVPRYLTQAILLEVYTDPKPGLVTRKSNGSHSDMSIFTFAMSSAVLSKAFYDMYEIGRSHSGDEQSLLKAIREYGKGAEKELLHATKGVNTQRGILFAGGVISAAAGYAVQKNFGNENNQNSVATVINLVKKMTEGLVARELAGNHDEPATAGEKLYRYYDVTGIRGEVEEGFPSIMQYGLPAMNEAFERGASINDALVHSLLALMTVAEDSNVIWRSDMLTAEEVKTIAYDILKDGSVFTEKGRQAIAEACAYFERRRISPGGCADLLSVTVCFYLLANQEFPREIV